MKFPSGEANSRIKWISLLYRNLGNAAACAFVVITQQQQDGFPSPRNIWAHALPQTSRKEQRLACCFPVSGGLAARSGRDWHFTELVQETCWRRKGKATRLITPIISALSSCKERGDHSMAPKLQMKLPPNDCQEGSF